MTPGGMTCRQRLHDADGLYDRRGPKGSCATIPGSLHPEGTDGGPVFLRTHDEVDFSHLRGYLGNRPAPRLLNKLEAWEGYR